MVFTEPTLKCQQRQLKSHLNKSFQEDLTSQKASVSPVNRVKFFVFQFGKTELDILHNASLHYTLNKYFLPGVVLISRLYAQHLHLGVWQCSH